MITKNIGKNTLGDNNKMKVALRSYNRSTHDLSYVWRNTQAVGTLVPFCSIPMMKGDTFQIKLQSSVLTHPTIGPLYGSFKLQNDLFFCPIRLYNSWLHNNKLKIGLNMSQIKLPGLRVTLQDATVDELTTSGYYNETSPSSLLAYLGITAYGRNSVNGKPRTQRERLFNGVPLLAYYDIFKNYYANKQEENFQTVDNSNLISMISLEDANPSVSIQDPNHFLKSLAGNLRIEGVTESEKFMNGTNQYYIDSNNIGGIKYTQINKNIFELVEENGADPILVRVKTEAASYVFTKIYVPAQRMKSSSLEDLDTIRELLLAAPGNTTYNIGWPSTSPKFFRYLLTGSENTPTDKTEYGKNFQFDEWGLVTKTYQSDLCQNWINTEWLDGADGINSITAVDVSEGSFTIDALNLANKVYNMLNRIAVSDGSYRSWLETVYTQGYTERTETPIYCGGSSAEIIFQEVVSTAGNGEEPLGTLAGRGKDVGHKGGHVTVRATEPGYLIGITSITPRLDYTQGNQWDVNLKTIDDFHKPALDGIGFQDLSAELLDARTTSLTNNIAVQQFIGKQPAWIDYMTNINKAYGNFRTNENFMILSRQYEVDNAGNIQNLTTYIDPSLYNGIFADQSFNAQNFWVQLGIDIKARRLMSAKVIPNL